MISFGKSSAGGVHQLVLVLGDADLVARIDPLLLDLDPVDLHAVATLHVADEPVAAVDEQLAVVGGDIGEAEHDIATLAAANQKLFFQERDGIAAPLGD
jgi:hypothetical protein